MCHRLRLSLDVSPRFPAARALFHKQRTHYSALFSRACLSASRDRITGERAYCMQTAGAGGAPPLEPQSEPRRAHPMGEDLARSSALCTRPEESMRLTAARRQRQTPLPLPPLIRLALLHSAALSWLVPQHGPAQRSLTGKTGRHDARVLELWRGWGRMSCPAAAGDRQGRQRPGLLRDVAESACGSMVGSGKRRLGLLFFPKWQTVGP